MAAKVRWIFEILALYPDAPLQRLGDIVNRCTGIEADVHSRVIL